MIRQERETVVAAFEDRDAAQRAVDELEQKGFSHDHVGFVIRGEEAVSGGMITDAKGTKDGKGAVTGIASGGAIGGILGALVVLALPGIGPVLAGGILAAVLGGGAAGAAVGGLIGAMTGLGISEREAKWYEHEFQHGRAIVAVKAGKDRALEAGSILHRHGGYDMETRRDSPIPTEGRFSEP